MINFLRQFLKPKYETLNSIKISKENILNNFKVLQENQKAAAIFPVLKSNAYGHGLKEICQILNDSDAPMVAVDSFPEAQVAYRYFKRKILILGEMPPKVYSYCKLARTEFCVYNQSSLEALASLGKAKIHLFINSGMNREGIKNLPTFLSENKDLLKKVEVVGFCSHLLAAEEGSVNNNQQLAVFLGNLKILREAGYSPKWVHLGNSAAIFTLKNENLSAFRSGLALYGYSPLPKNNSDYYKTETLKPALSLTSTIISLQDLKVGETVSYNGIYVAEHKTKIAVIPFGYYEGLPRKLSNLATFMLKKDENKSPVKIAGNICMNLTCLDLGNLAGEIGDKIEIITNAKDRPNSLDNLTILSEGIIYEFLVGLQANIRRYVS